MKSEPKAFASLSSGLLARKGAARPAMKPQGFSQIGGNLDDLGWDDMGFEPPKPALSPVRDDEHDAFGDELPEQPLRNPVAALTPSQTPVPSPVHDQQAEIAGRLADADAYTDDEDEDEEQDETAELVDFDQDDLPPQVAEVVALPPRAVQPRRVPAPRAAPGTKGKAAFTLRLDPARHLKLRLACAVTGRSAQMLVTDALDELLGAMPELDGMAERAPNAGSRANRKG
ncbi:MAG TPA: hypothetical protein VK485_09175 [Sphingomicrobium sp.]|nr:hypothetical protein [Sphingomicrobium sp.]